MSLRDTSCTKLRSMEISKDRKFWTGILDLAKKNRTENQSYPNRCKQVYMFCAQVLLVLLEGNPGSSTSIQHNFFKLHGLPPHRPWNASLIKPFGWQNMIFLMPKDTWYMYPFEWLFCYRACCRLMHAKYLACFSVLE